MSELDSLELTWHDWRATQFELPYAYQGPPISLSKNRLDSLNLVVWRIDQGSARVESAYGDFFARAGEWVLHCPGQRIQRFSQDAQIRSTWMKLRWKSGANVVSGKTPILSKDEDMVEFAEGFELLMSHGKPEASRRGFRGTHRVSIDVGVEIEEIAKRMLKSVLRVGMRSGWCVEAQHAIDPRITRVLDILTRKRLDERLDKARLAEEISLSTAHLNRIFFASQKKTPKQFFDERRLMYAREELLRGISSVKEISSHLGFSSLQRFSAWFKGQEGVSPRVFRGLSAQPRI